MKTQIKLSICIAFGFALSACNDGSVSDQHAITFEQAVPNNGPSTSQALSVLNNWLVANYPDGATARDVSTGPVRYAAILFPFPEKDYFVCSTFIAKNQYGTYLPPKRVLMTMRDYENDGNWSVALVKDQGAAAYRQYCVGQPHL